MTVVVSDLVARLRSEGVQETTSALAAADQQAKATGESLDQLARKFAATQGGTASGWREVLDRQGLSAAQVATQLGTASTNAGRLATAAQQIAAPTQAAAKAAAEVHEGFNLSAGSVGRFAAGVVGLGVGLSLATKLASTVHDAVAGIVDRQLEWERSLRLVSALYGQIGPQVLATAQMQAAMPGGLGSEAENVQAALNARFLSTRYGLSQSDVSNLAGTGVRVSGFLGLTEQRDREALQAQLVQFAEGGGSGLRYLGLEGDPEAIARRLGIASAAGLQGLTPQQITRANVLAEQEHLNRLASTATDPNSLLSQRTSLERGILEMQDNIRRGLSPGGAVSQYEAMGPELTGAFPGTPYAAGQPGAIATQADQLAAMQAKVLALTGALDSAGEAADKARDDLNKLGLEAGSATVRLLTFRGSLEDPMSIARGDIAAQAQAAVTAASRSSNPLRAMSGAEMGALARGTAAAQVWQNFVAEIAQQQAPGDVRRNLEDQIRIGPGANRAAAARALAELPRREAAQGVITQAQRAGDFANRASEIAQGQITALDLQAQERRLGAAEQLAGLRRETLNTEEQMAPLLLRQADLQDRMVVASRDNLNTTRAMISAQQAALPSQFGLADIDFGQKMLQARADASRAAFLRTGQAPEDIGDLRRQFYELDIQRAEQTPEALQRQRDVELVGRTATQEGLGRALRLTDLEQERRALEDQTIPLNQHLRITQAEEASIARRLELRDLDDTKARTAAQFALTAADGLQLLARTAAGAAADYAAGLDLGASASEQIKGNLQAGYQAMNDTALALSNIRGMLSPPSPEGLGPTPAVGGGSTMIIQINASDRSAINAQINAALDQFLSGTATAGPPAPSGVAGDGR